MCLPCKYLKTGTSREHDFYLKLLNDNLLLAGLGGVFPQPFLVLDYIIYKKEQYI